MDHISKISRLIALHLSGLITEAEEQELQDLLTKYPEEKNLFSRLSEDRTFKEQYIRQTTRDTEEAIRKFDRLTGGQRNIVRRKLLWSSAAVILLGMMIGGIWTIKVQTRQTPLPETRIAAREILPGNSKAILKLADGQTIHLSDSLSEMLISDHINLKKGELVYSGKSTDIKEYNELVLPRGGEYRLVLSDGTVVRLNSGSTLRYPVSFSGKQRVIELTGEAFFEVATDTLRPFCVKTAGVTIKAYGTTFNVNTLTPGHVYTALVEGSVGISAGESGQEYRMQPSQLADFNHHTRKVDIRTTDLSPYIAWTKGRFVFVNETLEQMFNTLGLWYDFDVVFKQEALRQLHFSGSMKRYAEIGQITDAISYTVGVKIRQEGKTLIIEK